MEVMNLTKITKPEVVVMFKKKTASLSKSMKSYRSWYCRGITQETQLFLTIRCLHTVTLAYHLWCWEICKKHIQQINEFGQNCCTVPSETKSICLNTAEELLMRTPLLVVNTVAVFNLGQWEEIKRNMPQAVEVNCWGSRKTLLWPGIPSGYVPSI